MSRVCHRCGRAVGAIERVGRRDTCLGCGSDLHSCLNCGFYDPAYHNQCRETQAERQVDKERGNFCEYFSFAARSPDAAPAVNAARAKLEGLFSDGRPVEAGVSPAAPPQEAPGRAARARGRDARFHSPPGRRSRS
jgi:hypothetical protein